MSSHSVSKSVYLSYYDGIIIAADAEVVQFRQLQKLKESDWRQHLIRESLPIQLTSKFSLRRNKQLYFPSLRRSSLLLQTE